MWPTGQRLPTPILQLNISSKSSSCSLTINLYIGSPKSFFNSEYGPLKMTQLLSTSPVSQMSFYSRLKKNNKKNPFHQIQILLPTSNLLPHTQASILITHTPHVYIHPCTDMTIYIYTHTHTHPHGHIYT